MADHRILIIDDEPAVLEQLKLAFASKPWTVDIEPSAKEGHARHNSNPYDLIMTDKNMPELDGVELLILITDSDFNPSRLIAILIPLVARLCQKWRGLSTSLRRLLSRFCAHFVA